MINLEDFIKVINKIYFFGGLGGLDVVDIGGVEVKILVVWWFYIKKISSFDVILKIIVVRRKYWGYWWFEGNIK